LIEIRSGKVTTNSENMFAVLERIANSLERIANKLDPLPGDKVGTPYVAEKLGCTTIWVTELIRKGEIPPSCIVTGTGNGKLWKFHRSRIDAWLASR
jgi:predicted DNA-binding transcriptional regulator AlpA